MYIFDDYWIQCMSNWMISVDQQWIRWMNNGFRGWAMDNGLTMDL